MQSSIQEAKKRVISNVITNFLDIFVSGLVGIWLTPYLIHNLTVEVYGMIALSLSIVGYFRIFTVSISNTVSRFVAIHLSKQEIIQSNVYFNSAIVALIGLCGILSLPAIILVMFSSRVFQTPVGHETATGWLFFQVMIASFITAITSPFMVSTLITHRFDLRNITKMLSQVLRVLVILICFTYLSASLVYVGLSYLLMTLFIFTSSVLIAKWLTPQLSVDYKMFRWEAACEMSRMGVWMLMQHLGALLFINISIVVINILLGPAQCGRYAPIAQLATLLALFGVALSNLFTPIAYDNIAKNNIKILSKQLARITKFLSLIMALPVGLLCGLSVPILQRWLGPSFADLWPLVLLIIGPWQIVISIRPTCSVHEGFNKVKLPAIVIITVGLLNLLLSILLIKFTSMGVFGVGLSLCICLVLRNLFFTPIYTATIIGQRKTMLVKELFMGMAVALLVGLAAFGLTSIFYLATIPRLLAVMVFLTTVYTLFCYFLILNKEERAFLMLLVTRKSTAYQEKKDELKFRDNCDQEI